MLSNPLKSFSTFEVWSTLELNSWVSKTSSQLVRPIITEGFSILRSYFRVTWAKVPCLVLLKAAAKITAVFGSYKSDILSNEPSHLKTTMIPRELSLFRSARACIRHRPDRTSCTLLPSKKEKSASLKSDLTKGFCSYKFTKIKHFPMDLLVLEQQ